MLYLRSPGETKIKLQVIGGIQYYNKSNKYT